MTDRRLLIVDDQPEIADFIGVVAESEGFDVRVANNALSFKQLYSSFAPDVIVLDIVMPDEDGFELIKYLADDGCRSHVITISGYDSVYLDSTRLLARDLGLPTITTLTKPIELEDLKGALRATV